MVGWRWCRAICYDQDGFSYSIVLYLFFCSDFGLLGLVWLALGPGFVVALWIIGVLYATIIRMSGNLDEASKIHRSGDRDHSIPFAHWKLLLLVGCFLSPLTLGAWTPLYWWLAQIRDSILVASMGDEDPNTVLRTVYSSAHTQSNCTGYFNSGGKCIPWIPVPITHN